MNALHFKRLEQMYLGAPVSEMYPGLSIVITEGKAIISLPIVERYFHAAGALHGSVYFKLLDDAAYFAAASRWTNTFLVTVEYHIRFLLPVKSGIITATGSCQSKTNHLIPAEATLHSLAGDTLATGKGVFTPSSTALANASGYQEH